MSRPAFADLTPEELEAKCQGIIDACEAREVPPTIERLAWELGVAKDTIKEYRSHEQGEEKSRKDAYAPAIKRAYQRIEMYHSEQGTKGKPGSMFYNKCAFAWREGGDRDEKPQGPYLGSLDLRVTLTGPDGRRVARPGTAQAAKPGKRKGGKREGR